MNTLFVTIKKEYFDQILSGIKTEEYRIKSTYWTNRLSKKHDKILFQNGYSKASSRLIADIIYIKEGELNHKYFGEKNVCVFKIGLRNPVLLN